VNVPNAITLARALLAGVGFALLEAVRLAAEPFAENTGPGAPDTTAAWWAFGLFVVAASTDWLDGFIARRTGQVTRLGRVLDPFVDKILVCGTLIMLLGLPAARALLPPWIVAVVVARELFVTTLRGVAEAEGRAFPADRSGKLKMVVQSVTIAALLAFVAGTDGLESPARVGVWLTLALTLWSGIHYCIKARDVLRVEVAA